MIMDAHKTLLPFLCHKNDANPLVTLGLELSCILVLSHFFHLVLKPFGQPGPIAQMLAGLVLGPSGLSQIGFVKSLFFREATVDYYQSLAVFGRIIFMFQIGLEMDVPYLMRTRRLATGIAFGSVLVCCIFGASISPFMYQQTHSHGGVLPFTLIIMLVLSNTASPIVIRLATELKLATSDVGRLAISSSLINDITCLLVVALMTALSKGVKKIWKKIEGGFFSILLLGAVIFLNQYVVRWLNRRNHNRKYLKNTEVLCILSLIIATSLGIELLGYNSIVTCFLLGLMFPREGKTARTLLHKLTYPVQTFILPIYFGYTGFQADFTKLSSFYDIIIIVFVILSSIGGKMAGTLAACHYLKIPLNEGVILAFLLNLKGHVDLLVISAATQKQKLSVPIYNLLVITVVINTILVGPIVTLIMQREGVMAFRNVGLEWQDSESELRMLACIHGPRHVSTMLELIAASTGSNNAPIIPYLMHLVELTEKSTANLMYHQQEEEEVSDDEYYGGHDALEINEAVDAFTAKTGIMIRQFKAVSRFTSMYEDVCDSAEDLRASVILLPFHKHRRIDGVMESGKEGIRTTSQKVLRHAPCSVAILVDRGLGGRLPKAEGSDDRHQIATLFFGGPDDREALAFSSRMAMHPGVNLTVIRFLPLARKEGNGGINIMLNKDEEVLMAISSNETQNDLDGAFLASFHGRYVTSGQVGYVEKQVQNGSETVKALREAKDVYSLFIVGKGGRGLSPLITGMSDWEECPELGAVGDLLAASDFGISSSVLVVQQHRWVMKEVIDD